MESCACRSGAFGTEETPEKFETIAYEIERGRARITLNRPEKRNALSYQLLSELHEALWEADADVEVHAVILRGAGKSDHHGFLVEE